MDIKTHWEKVYRTKQPNQVSWYRPHLEMSLQLIDCAAPNRNAQIIDVGGGESTLEPREERTMKRILLALALAVVVCPAQAADQAACEPARNSGYITGPAATDCSGRQLTPADAAVMTKKALQVRYCEGVVGMREWTQVVRWAEVCKERVGWQVREEGVDGYERCASAAGSIRRLYKERFEHEPSHCK